MVLVCISKTKKPMYNTCIRLACAAIASPHSIDRWGGWDVLCATGTEFPWDKRYMQSDIPISKSLANLSFFYISFSFSSLFAGSSFILERNCIGGVMVHERPKNRHTYAHYCIGVEL